MHFNEKRRGKWLRDNLVSVLKQKQPLNRDQVRKMVRVQLALDEKHEDVVSPHLMRPHPHLILASSSPHHPHLIILTLALSSPHAHLIVSQDDEWIDSLFAKYDNDGSGLIEVLSPVSYPKFALILSRGGF